MKKTCIAGGVLVIFFMCASQATAIFSSSYSLEGTLHADTVAFFLGKTNITGNSTGYPMERIINSPLVHDMNAYPLIGNSSIANLDSVIVVENIDITTVSSLEELYQKYFDHITEYSNVTVTTENGISLLGINHGTMHVSSELPYAVTTFLPFEITPGSFTRFFFVASIVPITMRCSGDYTVLTGLSNTSTLQVTDPNGVLRWSGVSKNTYLVFQKDTFMVTQHPPVLMFPLRTSMATEPLVVSIVPAATQDIVLKQLITNVTGTVQNLGEYNITSIVDNIGTLEDFLKSASPAANGAALFLYTNDTMTIDHTTQRFSNGGFIRFTTLGITSVGTLGGPTLQGDCSLIYLGNYFYNPQAKVSPTGTTVPYELVILWIIAVSVFFSSRFFSRPDVNEKKTKEINRYVFVLQFLLLLIGILLLDTEVNSQFGISAITALFTQGFSLITGVFVLVELIVWVLGFLLLGLPVQILVNSGLRYLGIGEGGKGLGRGIGFLSIWVFSGFYLLLMLNVIVSFIHFDILAPTG